MDTNLAQFSEQGGGYQIASVFIWGSYNEGINILQQCYMGVGLLLLTQVFMEYIIKDGGQVLESLWQSTPSGLSTKHTL